MLRHSVSVAFMSRAAVLVSSGRLWGLSPRAGVLAAAAVWWTAPGALAAELAVPQQYETIQAAINAASDGDRVLVSAGIYHEQVNLSGKGIQLIAIAGSEFTAIDGDDVRTVIVGSNEPATCVVRGFTIQHGRDYGYNNGGGVKIRGSSATFSECRFVANRAVEPAWWGGGAWLSEYGNPRIDHCTFVGNYGGGNVAGVYHYLGGGITVSDCVFQDNTSASGQCIHIQTEGGTIAASIQRCTFRRFESNYQGGGCYPVGFWNPYGGMINCSISDCIAEEPRPFSGAQSGMVGFMAIGSYPDASYGVTLTNIQCCGVQNLVQSDGHSAWVDGGGNVLGANCCPADANRDGIVDGRDLGVLLVGWGTCIGCKSDTSGDGQIDGVDLGVLISAWGPCP